MVALWLGIEAALGLSLAVDPPVAGVVAWLTVSDATPGATVAVGYSLTGPGSGACPPALGGLCLDLLDEVVLGTAVADAGGVAALSAPVPPAATGRAVWLQAVELGAAPAKSPVVAESVATGQLSLRFYGNGGLFGDRIRVPVDDPATALPGPPVDVGAGDFTVELWLRTQPGWNANPMISCGWGFDWVNSNIFLDRDRHSQSPSWGAGLAAERLVFAVNGDYAAYSLCGSTPIADGAWHHVAVQRRRSDGRMQIWLDGALEAEVTGPGGDLSYPDAGVPLSVCPAGSCNYSDPYLVFGAEKHGYGGISYNGWMDEVRVSDALRYTAPFVPVAAPFATDASTVGLYHFDEGWGPVTTDASAHPGGATDGEVRSGGVPAGPRWEATSPF